MIKGYSGGRYEFFIVMIAIAIVLLFAVVRYQALANSARELGFEIISHHFMKGAADARVQWLLQARTKSEPAKSPRSLKISDTFLYFSPQAWPASTHGAVSENFQPHIDDCYGLWMTLLQNPAPISKEGEKPFGSRQYHVSTQGKACRYQLVDDDKDGTYYFDYFPLDGRVILSIPESTNFEN